MSQSPPKEKGKKKPAVTGLDGEGEDDKDLELKSQDEKLFPVSKKAALKSQLVKTMVEEDKEESIIPLPAVKGDTLSRVVEYLKHHAADAETLEIEKPLKSANLTEIVGEWDAKFVDVDQQTLFDLILAANYMDIKPLLDLTCAKVATMIKGKTTEQIRETFNIQNDFTPEEEEAVRAENRWAEQEQT